MDAVDVGILRCLGMQPWAEKRLPAEERQPAAIAKRLGVRPELVRDRIARLESSGVIAGYEVYPNFRLLGHEQTTFHYRVAAESMKAKAIERAAGFDGVVGVYGYLGPQLCVDICYRSDADKRRRLKVLGDYIGNQDAIVWIKRHPPRVDRELDLLDWKVIKALRGDAQRPLEEVSEELDTSLRTIRRRFARLRDEGSIDIVPKINPGRIQGMILAQLVIHLAPDAPAHTRRRLLQVLGDQLLFAMTPPDERLDAIGVLLVLPSIGALDLARRQAEDAEGVERAWVMVPSSILYDGSWIDEVMAEKIGRLTSTLAA